MRQTQHAVDSTHCSLRQPHPENWAPLVAEPEAATITPELIRQHAYSRKRYSYSLRPNSIAEGDRVEILTPRQGG